MARLPLQRVLALVLTGGYAFLLADTLIEHQGTFIDHPLALTPPVTAALGCVLLALAAANWSESLRRAAVYFGGIAMLVGLVGLVLHNEDRVEALAEGAVNWFTPPLLAPAAFCGLGLITILALARRWPDATPTG